MEVDKVKCKNIKTKKKHEQKEDIIDIHRKKFAMFSFLCVNNYIFYSVD